MSGEDSAEALALGAIDAVLERVAAWDGRRQRKAPAPPIGAEPEPEPEPEPQSARLLAYNPEERLSARQALKSGCALPM